MAASVFDSQQFTRLFPTAEVGKLFTDTAEVRAMMLVEGALARVQGNLGVIPETAAAFLHRASMEIQVDPAGLADPTGVNGVSVPGLIAAMRKALEAPEHAQFLHWGATSQDIMDTGQMLRIRQMLNHHESALRETIRALGTMAAQHADTPMAARTYGQFATGTSFGAVIAGWGAPLLGLLGEMNGLRERVLWVSLSGASGTGAALGAQAAQTRAELALALGLHDPQRSWHSDRSPIMALADWLTRLSVALAKMGEDLTIMVQSGVGEVTLGGAGGSSTMPQKQNPVAPSAMVALARQSVGLNAILQGAGIHRQQRDGAAWFTEWLTLPQLCLSATSALIRAQELAGNIAPDRAAMVAPLDTGLGLIHAEALSFRLAGSLPRPDAQAAIKTLCKQAMATDTPLKTLAAQAYPDIDTSDIFDPAQQMGHAPDDARAFAVLAQAVSAMRS